MTWEISNPTEPQMGRINRIIECKGEVFVKEYFDNRFPDGDYSNMNRKQAQKIVTGLDFCLPKKPIYGIRFPHSWVE